MAQTGAKRVVLAEDHPMMADQLRQVLETDFQVIQIVEDGRSLVAAVLSHAPDAIVSDIAMPGLDGIAAAREIRSRDPGARIVLVSVFDDEATIAQGMAAGALGFVSKSAAGEELVSAVRSVLQNEQYIARARSQRARH